MKRFDESNQPNLDVVVLAALELFMRQEVPRLDLGRCKKPLVVSSGNAAATGRILLEKADAVFADERIYEARLPYGYFVIGRLQSQCPPWFKNSLASYCTKASAVFGQTIRDQSRSRLGCRRYPAGSSRTARSGARIRRVALAQ